MKIAKKGEKLPAADVATGPRRRADVARGSTAPLRRGAEATWQGACGPRRRRTGARQMAGRPRATWAPVWGATCRGAERLIRIVNRGILSPIYAQSFPSFNPCGTMFPHDFLFCRRRGNAMSIGCRRNGRDRVDPSPRDLHQNTCEKKESK